MQSRRNVGAPKALAEQQLDLGELALVALGAQVGLRALLAHAGMRSTVERTREAGTRRHSAYYQRFADI